jgi:adenylate kinase
MFGPPGVGKGTQGQVLGCLLGFQHLSSGDCFRALDPDSDIAKEAMSFIDRGELAPDDLTFRVWKKAVDGLIAAGDFQPDRDVLILDGIPRSVVQAEALADHIDVLCLISLVSFDDDAMVERIKRRALESGRPDDADESVIRHRFDVYRRDTAPVLKYYPDDVKREVDALQTPAEVLKDVLECIIPAQAAYLSAAAH